MNESTKNIMSAISSVQQRLDVLKRESKADLNKYEYKYTGFPHMWTVLKPLLKSEGLVVIQSPVSTDGTSIGDYMRTEVYHLESGESKVWTMRLVVSRDDPQGFGSAITYAERYMIKTIFKVVTSDDDNDAVTQALATGEMKKDWVRAYTVIAKKTNPDAIVSQGEFVKFMTDVYGKHPTKVLAKEHNTVMDTIKAFES